MKNIIQYFLILIFSISVFQISAQDLIYKPRNPAFGGDVFNYNWMLSSANAQDLYKDPNAEEGGSLLDGKSQLETFTENLNRQILNQLSRSLIDAQFGEDGLQQGSYTIGNFNITIEDIAQGLSITIYDTATGGETQVIIPYY